MSISEPDWITDPDEIAKIGFDYLRGALPGWEPFDGDLLTWTIRAHARMIAEERDVAADVPAAILRYLGEKIHRIPPIPASAATVSATFTMRDRQGYTIPGGLEVFVRTAGDDGVTFVVQDAVTVPPGSDATAAGEVTLRAAPGYEGTVGNGLTADSQAVVIRSETQYQAVALVGESTGGVDPESDDDYLTRLATELTLTSPIPILPDDFAALARRHPQVTRALALNLYDPVADTWDNPRTVTVVVAGPDGYGVSRTVLDEVKTTLDAMREINWVTHVLNPSIDANAIDVEFEATTWPGEDPDVVRAAAIEALRTGLSPAIHGRRPGGLADDEDAWIDEPTVRYLEVAQMLQEVPGLRYVNRLQIGLEGGPLGTTDITLTGPGALPKPGSGITGTVTEG